ncbi:hypothetical protein ABPG72_001957 [Tetrahymena utriculariae]
MYGFIIPVFQTEKFNTTINDEQKNSFSLHNQIFEFLYFLNFVQIQYYFDVVLRGATFNSDILIILGQQDIFNCLSIDKSKKPNQLQICISFFIQNCLFPQTLIFQNGTLIHFKAFKFSQYDLISNYVCICRSFHF